MKKLLSVILTLIISTGAAACMAENGTDEYTVGKAMREMDISSRNRVLGYAEAMSQK